MSNSSVSTRGARTWGCAALIALAITAAGCGGGGSSGAASGGGSSQGSASLNHVEHGTAVFGSLPPTGTPMRGGTISFGQITDETPTQVFPLLDGADTSTADFELNAAMFLPLYNGPRGAVPTVNYAQSVATAPPKFTDGNRTVTISLRRGLKWSDGAPVDASDVLFYIALCKAAVKESAANWSQYIPGQFPDSVVRASAPNAHTVVLRLRGSFNPGYFVDNQMQDTGGGLYPMPSTAWNIDRAGGPHLNWRDPAVAKQIYDYLAKAGRSVSTFASDPLWRDVDGPFSLKSFSSVNGSFVLVPNRHFGLSPKPVFSRLSVQTFTSPTSALSALETGSVDVIPIDPSQVDQAGSLRSRGINVFGAPSFGWAAAKINFKDRADDFDHVIAQRYVRAALEHLVDQPGLIKGPYKGAAAPVYGPVPSQPHSPYAPASATKPTYPYSPAAAVGLLKAHGWKVVPGGETTCAKPGTGAGECGAQIPRGTPIKFVWVSAPATANSAEVSDTQAVASIAKQAAGIEITATIKSPTTISDDYNDSDPSDARFENDWGLQTTQGVALTDYYPTQAGFDTPSGYNDGDYDSPTENRLSRASIHSGNLGAVKREANFLAHDLPQIYLPIPDALYAAGKGVGGPADSWLSLTEGSDFFPQYWYRTK